MNPLDDRRRAILVIALLLVFGLLQAILTGCTTTTKIVCPKLTAPPASVVDMLEGLGPKDPSAAAWTIDLDKHYQKLEAC